MERDRSPMTPSTDRVIAGYIASVTVGALVFVFVATMSRITTFESATNFPLWQKAIHLLFMTGLMFVLSWMVAIAACAFPCCLLSFLARSLKIRNLIFYAIAGICVGLLMVGIFKGFFNSFHWYTDPPKEKEITWRDGILAIGRFLGPAGGVAGFTYWKIAGRHYR
jgi:hypothetical protein